jgi:hypothetical protein
VNARGDPAVTPSRPIATPLPSRREDIHSLTGGGEIDAEVAARLWELHWHHGYFTRAEIEAALGLDPPREAGAAA